VDQPLAVDVDKNSRNIPGKGTVRSRVRFVIGQEAKVAVLLKRRKIMMGKNYLTAVAILAIAAGVQWVSVPAYAATEQGEQRQEARDTKQTGRQDAREQKAECKAGDEKSRAECRQEKRGTKQESRETARDIKQE
jgi:hypothetical protein